MGRAVFINARFVHAETTGVQRTAKALCGELEKSTDIHKLLPPKWAASGLWGHLWEQLVLPYRARGGTLLSLANTGPIFHARHFVLLHDMACFSCPESFSFSFRLLYRVLIPRIVLNAKGVLTVSEKSKREILKYIKRVCSSKITVIYNGIDGDFFKPANSRLIEETAKRFQLKPNNYILVVGSFSPRKNLNMVFEVWRKFTAVNSNTNIKLLVVGGANSRVFGTKDLYKDYAGVDRVEVAGYMPDEYLPMLYSGALCTLFPSYYEGFGFPVLESLCCATPVITSLGTAMEELFGDLDGVMLVDPHSADAVFSALEDVCGDINYSDQYNLPGQRAEILDKFNWGRAARSIHAIISESAQADQ